MVGTLKGEDVAMSSRRKARALYSHAQYCKECESSATTRYRTQLGPLLFFWSRQ